MKKPKLGDLLRRLRRLLGRDPDIEDPYVGVRVPLRKGPGDLSATLTRNHPRE